MRHDAVIRAVQLQQLGAQRFDVRVYRTVGAVGVRAPHGRQQSIARADAPAVLQQVSQQTKFAPRQVQQLVVQANPLAWRVHREYGA